MKKILSLLALVLMSCMGAWAQTPFRAHRYDVFKSMPINNQSIVFVGNSITNMHPWVEAFGNDSRIVNRGNSGGTSAEILANVRSYCVGQPAKIFLMIGINDKPNGSNHATIVSNIQQTIATIKEVSPSTKIYLQSILPANFGGATPTYIAQCNTELQQMLIDRGYTDVTYVDVYNQLLGKLDTDNTGIYSFDKLHTTAAGYAIWTDYIKSYVDATPVYPSEAATKVRQQNGGNTGSWGARATYFSMFPIESDDVLFFGDEMVHGGEWQELLGNIHVKNRGTSWGYEGTNGWMSYTKNDVKATFATVEGVNKTCPKQVLLYTGTGEANGTGDMTTIVNYYKGIVSDIRGYAPTAKISLVSLMPTNTGNNTRVKEFNSAIESYANATDNVEYIDIYSTLATNDSPKAAYFPNSDNMLHGDGYVAVANVLADHIADCHPVTPEQATAYRKLVKGTNADEDFFEEGWYQIQIGEGTAFQHADYRGKYIYANSHVNGSYTWAMGLTGDATDLKTYVYITGEHDKWHIEFNHGTSNAYFAAANCTTTNTAANLSFIPNGDKTQWKIWGNNASRWIGWNIGGPSVGSTSTTGNDSYDNCYFIFTKVVAPEPINVTYTFTVNGQEIGSKEIEEIEGAAPTVSNIFPEYVEAKSGMPVKVSESAYTIETGYKDGVLPFSPGRFYVVFFRNGSNYYYWNDDNSGVGNEVRRNGNNCEINTREQLDTHTTTAKWKMGGDWLNGFTFTNLVTKKTLTSPASFTAGGSFKLNDEAATCFDIAKMTNGHYRFYPHGQTTYFMAHTSHDNHRVTMWNVASYGITSEAEGGAGVVQFEDITDATIAALQDKVDAVADGKGKIGYPKSMNSLEATVTIDNYEATSDLLATLNADTDINLPEDGKAYVFTNIATDKSKHYLYENTTSGKVLWADRGNGTAEDIPTNGKYICRVNGNYFTFVNAETGHYLIWRGSNAGENSAKGYTEQYNADYGKLVVEQAVYNSGNMGNATNQSDLFGWVCVCGTRPSYNGIDKCFLYSNGTDSFNQDTGHTQRYGNGHSSMFAIEEVENPNKLKLTNPNEGGTSGLDGKYVGTFSAPYNVELPAGVKAYKASVDGSIVTFTEIGNVVPKNVGVLVYKEDATEAVDVAAVPAISTTSVEGNVFAAMIDGTIAAGDYVLGKGTNGVGFYARVNPTTAKNKAYIPASAGSNLSVFRFDFEDSVTGIEAVESNALEVYFDLQGRRVQGGKSGLYIVNGKRVIR